MNIETQSVGDSLVVAGNDLDVDKLVSSETNQNHRVKFLAALLLGLIVIALLVVFLLYTFSFPINKKSDYEITEIKEMPIEQIPSQVVTPSTMTNTIMMKNENQKYQIEMSYPNDWSVQNQSNNSLKLVNKINNHEIDIMIWRVTGFGYCFSYSDKNQIVVSDRVSETAVGIGGTPMCDDPEGIYSKLGNIYVLVPVESSPDSSVNSLPPEKIQISYNYPINELNQAQKTLEQILSTIKISQLVKSNHEIIPISSTEGWVDHEFLGLKFKTPATAKIRPGQCYGSSSDCVAIGFDEYYDANGLITSLYLTVVPKDRASTSQILNEYINTQADACGLIKIEGSFGTVKATQNAIDGNLCQGSGGGNIITNINGNTVIVSGLEYDPKSKIIFRNLDRDTIISTFN